MKRLLAGLLGVVFVLSVAHAYALRVQTHFEVPYSNTVPDAHLRQVEQIRRHVPPGSTILYLDSQVDEWNMGLFRRSLYPGYVVVPATNPGEIAVLRGDWAAAGLPVRAALVTRRYRGPDPGFMSIAPLPDNPLGVPLDLGIWTDGPAAR